MFKLQSVRMWEDTSILDAQDLELTIKYVSLLVVGHVAGQAVYIIMLKCLLYTLVH